MKHKRLTAVILISVILVVLALHSVPIYNKTGFVLAAEDAGGPRGCLAVYNLDIQNYRIIPDGLAEFRQDKSTLEVTDQAKPESQLVVPDDKYDCAQAQNLRLYLW